MSRPIRRSALRAGLDVRGVEVATRNVDAAVQHRGHLAPLILIEAFSKRDDQRLERVSAEGNVVDVLRLLVEEVDLDATLAIWRLYWINAPLDVLDDVSNHSLVACPGTLPK